MVHAWGQGARCHSWLVKRKKWLISIYMAFEVIDSDNVNLFSIIRLSLHQVNSAGFLQHSFSVRFHSLFLAAIQMLIYKPDSWKALFWNGTAFLNSISWSPTGLLATGTIACGRGEAKGVGVKVFDFIALGLIVAAFLYWNPSINLYELSGKYVLPDRFW